MKKGIFLLLVSFLSLLLYGQDSCFQFPARFVNIINNPSFEINPLSCNSGYFNEQGLVIPFWTTPTNEVLTGYLNSCTNFLIPNDSIFNESFTNVYMYMFPLVPQPIPDGNGVAAVADFGYDGNTHEYPFRKSYVSTCLTSLLQKDSLYRLDFYVGFGTRGNDTLLINNGIAVPETPRDIEKFTLFGFADCTNNNVPIIGCPAVSGWTPLGSYTVHKTQNWMKVSIKFKSPDNFQAMALGPSCDTVLELDPAIVVYNGDTVSANRHSYFLDALQLYKSTVPFPQVQVTAGTSCSQMVSLRVQPAIYDAGYQLQWYKNGMVLNNENNPALSITRKNYGTGYYQCQVQNDSTCLISDSLYVPLSAIPNASILGKSDTLACTGDTVLLNAFTDTSSAYLWQDGSTLPVLSATESGHYSVNISNACGSAQAQKTVNFQKCVLDLFLPNAFTPNGDGKNDFFKVRYVEPPLLFNLNVYTRYGQLIFSSADPSAQWDGTFKGKPQPAGTYVYETEFTDRKKIHHVLKGTVELIR
ncbi:MAG TPA: T9SS type B sorting domain-containing protein [Puia sp.]|nr:T9SS type B sorting domain-containing protein [Puia sp.]